MIFCFRLLRSPRFFFFSNECVSLWFLEVFPTVLYFAFFFVFSMFLLVICEVRYVFCFLFFFEFFSWFSAFYLFYVFHVLCVFVTSFLCVPEHVLCSVLWSSGSCCYLLVAQLFFLCVVDHVSNCTFCCA